MKPALTRDQWSNGEVAIGSIDLSHSDEGLHIAQGNEIVIDGADQAARHAIAAVMLHGQPGGFTREDVGYLRMMTEQFQHTEGVYTLMVNQCRGLADRIEALLPPEDE